MYKLEFKLRNFRKTGIKAKTKAFCDDEIYRSEPDRFDC